ncbi:MAG: anti-sigma factor [Actinomycetota bacterium]
MNHEHIEESLAVRVLGGLDDTESAALENEMAAHGDCAECRRIERELADTAGMLAFSLDPVSVDPGMADRILSAGREEGVEHANVSEPPPTAAADELAARRAGRGWRTFVAVAASIALVAVVATALRPGARSTGVSAQPAQTIVRFEGDAGALSMGYTPGEPGAIFWGSDLPAPGVDHVYEIWMIQGDTPVSGGCVEPDTQGNLAVYVEADIGSTELMAVTVEPADCPAAPTTDPVLTAPLDVA